MELDYREEDRGYLTPCYIWPHAKSSHGYGQVLHQGRVRPVHVVVDEARGGPLPPGYEVHHKCRQRDCLRIDHLQRVTRVEHRQEERKRFCKRGHVLAGNNLHNRRGRRACRECNKEAMRKRRLT